jgi:phosphatidate cytidylyltransferase
VSDWRDDRDRDQLDFDDEYGSAPTRAQGEGVRILGPDERDVAERSRRGPDDSPEYWGEEAADFDPPEGGDPTWSASTQGLPDTRPRRRSRGRRGRRGATRGADPASAEETREPLPGASGPTRLPHWTEPPTGEIPQVVAGPHDEDVPGDDDLDPWSGTAAGQKPRYRMEANDWADADYSDPHVLRDDSAPLGALKEPDLPDEDDDEAIEHEVSARRRGVASAGAAAARRRQPPTPPPPERGTLEEDEEPARTAPDRSSPGRSSPDLITRVLTAAAIAVVALIMLRLGRATTTFLVAVIVAAAAFELYEAFRRAGYHPATVLGLLACVSIVPIAYANGVAAFPLVTVLLVVFTMLWYMAEVVTARPIINIAITLFTFFYVGVFGAFAGLLLGGPDGTGLILGLAICAIGYDVAGYFIGTQFGRSHMSPRLSPNKTWEGLFGGMIASIILGLILGRVLAPWNGKITHGLLLGLVVAIAAPIGDLCESMIKRDLGLKDLGTILPGHGGVLDRFDAMLFCLPAVYYLAVQLNIG